VQYVVANVFSELVTLDIQNVTVCFNVKRLVKLTMNLSMGSCGKSFQIDCFFKGWAYSLGQIIMNNQCTNNFEKKTIAFVMFTCFFNCFWSVNQLQSALQKASSGLSAITVSEHKHSNNHIKWTVKNRSSGLSCPYSSFLFHLFLFAFTDSLYDEQKTHKIKMNKKSK